MFEKDAEEYADEKCGTIETEEKKFCRIDWQRGAEFGFNKANEWHKADEKPKVTKEYLVYLISGYNCRSVNMMIYNAERGFWCADNQNDVVYWKEIVLPELKESK